jgi:hypothetical protein
MRIGFTIDQKAPPDAHLKSATSLRWAGEASFWSIARIVRPHRSERVLGRESKLLLAAMNRSFVHPSAMSQSLARRGCRTEGRP